METSVRQHVHSVTLRTLHSHNFTRTSSQASAVLTDVVVRFIDLLALTTVQHAEHAGRRGANVFDAVSALEEVGMGVEELMEFVEGEGRDIARYSLVKAGGEEVIAGPSTIVPSNDLLPAVSRRIDSLLDIKSSLSQGKRIDSDDSILLRYERIQSPDISQTASPHDSPSPLPLGTPSSSPSSNGFHSLPNVLNKSKGKQRETESTLVDIDAMDISPQQSNRRPVTPTLPLSPVSNPAYSPPTSPTRKRPRTANWDPPPHIPDFLPPFPGQNASSSSQKDATALIKSSSFSDPSFKTSSPRQRLPPPPRLPLLSNVKSTYTKSIPYSLSSLAISSTGFDLPSETPTSSSQPSKPSASLQPLIAAYNIFSSETQPATNPSRLKVAHYLARTGPSRYTNPDTLFGGTSPNLPRFSVPLPSHPIPLDPTAKGPLPPPQSKPVNDRNGGEGGAGGSDLSMPHLQSNLSKLAKELLAPPIYNRTTHLPPPPPLFAPVTTSAPINPDPLSLQPPQPQLEAVLYAKPIMAPWNSEAASLGDRDDMDEGGKPFFKKKNKKGNEKGGDGGTLPDAKLYATWDWTSKEWTEPLVARRGRMDSFALGGNTSSSGPGAQWVGSPVVGTPGGMSVPTPIVMVKSPMLGVKKGTDDTVVGTPVTPAPSTPMGKIMMNRTTVEGTHGIVMNGHVQPKNVILVNGHNNTPTTAVAATTINEDDNRMDTSMMVDVKMNGNNSVLSASS